MEENTDADMEKDIDVRPTILLVDDSKLIRKSASKMLGDQFQVVVAENGVEAWGLIREDSTIRVIFTDLDMPEMDGYTLLENIRTHADEGVNKLPVIVVTGAENDEEAKEKAYQLGATDFITKPFNSTDIKVRAIAHATYQRRTSELKKSSNLDELTGLANKEGFFRQIEKDFSFVLRHKESIVLMMLELEDFRPLFMKIGKSGTDRILSQIAKLLIQLIRKEDTLSRVSVNQFAISFPTAQAQTVKKLAERVCAAVENFKITVQGEPLSIKLRAAVYVPEQKQMALPQIALNKLIQIMDDMKPGTPLCVQVDEVSAEEVARPDISTWINQSNQLAEQLESMKVSEEFQEIVESLFPSLSKLVSLLDDEQRQKLIS